MVRERRSGVAPGAASRTAGPVRAAGQAGLEQGHVVSHTSGPEHFHLALGARGSTS